MPRIRRTSCRCSHSAAWVCGQCRGLKRFGVVWGCGVGGSLFRVEGWSVTVGCGWCVVAWRVRRLLVREGLSRSVLVPGASDLRKLARRISRGLQSSDHLGVEEFLTRAQHERNPPEIGKLRRTILMLLMGRWITG